MKQRGFTAWTILQLALFVFFGATSYSQDPSITADCSTSQATADGQTIPHGGKFITSVGTLRVLVVFVRFPGDVDVSPTWPDPNVLPEWALHIVDTGYIASGNYTPLRSSRWFYENSGGNFHLIGDVYYVTTTNSEDYYHQLASTSGNPGTPRGAIVTDVLNKLDGAPYNVDFRRYDNW